MRKNYLKRALVVCALVSATIAAVISGWTKDARANDKEANLSQQAEAQAEPLMEQKYKNIQVLKGLPASQMRPLMNLIGASLGMRCDSCHVRNGDQWEFEKDDKNNKKTARKMIQMTMDLNKNSFAGRAEVSCFTCHNGMGHPANVPPLLKAAVEPAKPSAAQLTAQQVLAKYAQAIGSKEAAEKITTRIFKGQQLAANGQAAELELIYAGQDKVLSTVKLPQGEMVTAISGAAGWLKNPREQRAMDSVELARFKNFAASLDPLPLREPYPRLNYGGVSKVGEREAYVLRMMTPDRKRVQFYFDAQSGLLLRRVMTTETLLGLDPEQLDYEDYREVDGVKVPFTIRVTYLDNFFSATRKFTEIKHNAAVDDAKFAQPK
jgi:hypothetical protein